MKLSHKNKLMHKKGIPQRAWIGRCNRRFLRDVAKIEAVLNQSKRGECRRSFFMRGIWGRQKRTGKLRINKVKTYERFDRVEAKEPELIPTRELASGGYVTPEKGFQVGRGEPTAEVFTPDGKVQLLESHARRQSALINQIVVKAKSEESRSVLSVISDTAVRFGNALKGVFFSKSKEKSTL
ncbi:hypothetical protein R7007_21805 [Vibrio sp. 1636]|uniref:Uncharacterized protein n=1 Tax=Vibrio alginolyticus TaxID=663 RepID=A0A7Y0MZH5_VIBAL|nr:MULTISPECIES: hypothetical protein [Vibrio]MDW2204308.1 hypothetical protein [Vibrio sp. 1636]NMR76243.1 hypothetical protein [Vibrio alginolyticus]